jgi:predicted amino acid-binding ACT domain protein
MAERPSDLLTRPWIQYFQALDTRVGGASAPTILELEALLATDTTALAALTLRVAALEARVLTHLGTPTVQAVTAGAGVGAVVSVSGTDRAGTVTLVTAALADHRSNAEVLRLTFATAWTAAPLVQVQPANAAAYALREGRFTKHPVSVRLIQSAVTTTTFVLSVGVTSLPRAGDTYAWTYTSTGA